MALRTWWEAKPWLALVFSEIPFLNAYEFSFNIKVWNLQPFLVGAQPAPRHHTRVEMTVVEEKISGNIVEKRMLEIASIS